MPAMTAVYFVNVLRLLIIRVPRVPGANINEVPNSEKFSHSAGGPQLELRWGPGRAKRARARHTYTKTRKTAKSHLFSELGEMLGNTDKTHKKKCLSKRGERKERRSSYPRGKFHGGLKKKQRDTTAKRNHCKDRLESKLARGGRGRSPHFSPSLLPLRANGFRVRFFAFDDHVFTACMCV